MGSSYIHSSDPMTKQMAKLNPPKSMMIFLLLMIFFVGDTQKAFAELPFVLPSKTSLARLQTASIRTNKGNIFIELYPNSAPIHVANFKFRADKGLYRNTRFHKIIPGYVVQAGKSKTSYSIPAEFNDYPQERGTIGMARLEDVLNPERASDPSQIYILLGEAPHMKGKYTNFGKVIGGFEILDKLTSKDYIEDIQVFVR